MMKWKARTETTNIGVLELGSLTFDEDYMEVSIDICGMSDSLKAEVDKAIEIKKLEHTERYNALNQEKGLHLKTVWSNELIALDFTYLRVILEEGKPIHYSVCVGFHDSADELMEDDCEITVDLSGHTNELKKAIIKVLLDKFF